MYYIYYSCEVPVAAVVVQ